MDRRDAASDLARDERFAADRALVVEQDAVRCMQAVGLAIVDGNPICVELGGGIGRARIKWRRLALWDGLNLAVKLRSRRLIEARFVAQLQKPDRLQQAQRSYAVSVCRIFGCLEGHLHVRLSR